ncbi:uncharacterized protein LOC113303040 [Papaver somniferum]|uniref:uncharacterized protein LOC113303040 n=1 Tax=Papaver somniferum TaxID=3469 RepID=UPI000E6FA9F7|nr:uncharacterized protein LOC113303040 [Papaver somniferum]
MCSFNLFQNTEAPFLILCSEDDELAPYLVIYNFAQRLQDLGGDVKLVKWNCSPHAGHYSQYPADYKAAVTELLSKAVLIYSRRLGKLEGDKTRIEGNHVGVSESIYNLQKATTTSCESFRRVAIDPSDYFFLPNSGCFCLEPRLVSESYLVLQCTKWYRNRGAGYRYRSKIWELRLGRYRYSASAGIEPNRTVYTLSLVLPVKILSGCTCLPGPSIPFITFSF